MKIYTNEELDNRNKALIEIKNVFNELKINFFLVDGILLGAIREKNFIKWDWDVELAVFAEDIIDKIDLIIARFKDEGFDFQNPDNSFKNVKINLFKYDNKFSIVGLYKKGKYRQRKLFRYPAKFFNEPLPINFRGEEYYAPSPINEFLSFVYGDDWAIPKMTNNKEEYLNKKHFNTNQIIVLIQRIINKITKRKS